MSSGRPDAAASSQDTREIKISKNERDWLEYLATFLTTGVVAYGGGGGYSVSYRGDEFLTNGGKDNMVRRANQIVRRFDKAKPKGARR